METEFILIISYLITVGHCEIIPFIANGQDASITNFPYSAHLSIKCWNSKSSHNTRECKLEGESINYICGSSILNQYLTLTAAHCTETCSGKIAITVSVGDEVKSRAVVSSVHSYYNHRKFQQQTLNYDIGLVRVNTPFKLNSKISRVAIMEDPPYNEEALVCSWGLIDEAKKRQAGILQFTKQYVQSEDECQKTLRFHHKERGTICASSNDKSYMARGDSGSPLVVRGYIQIGIVSYKYQTFSDQNVCIYTDTGYFYEWIQEHSEVIMCSK